MLLEARLKEKHASIERYEQIFFRIYFYCPVVPIFLLMLYLYPECINNFIKLLAVCYSSPFVMIIGGFWHCMCKKKLKPSISPSL